MLSFNMIKAKLLQGRFLNIKASNFTFKDISMSSQQAVIAHYPVFF